MLFAVSDDSGCRKDSRFPRRARRETLRGPPTKPPRSLPTGSASCSIASSPIAATSGLPPGCEPVETEISLEKLGQRGCPSVRQLPTAALGVGRRCPRAISGTLPGEKLISAAEQAGSADYYRSAGAADLPFENCSFDLAVAYNVLMDIEDVPAALKEVRRVLRPSGTLVISIVGSSLVRRPTLRS